MKRLLIQALCDWKNKPIRKPLILKGVRQTGKTYLLEQFGQKHFTQCHTINFEKLTGADQLFKQDLNPKRIINELQFFTKTDINIKEDLVIFDEIQACPQAITSLKYFCEELPELALCSAGSLLGLHLNDASFPVGKVDMLHLYPMTFLEFLEGIGDQQACSALVNIDLNTALPEVVHQHLWMRLKHYFITGGLPEVVSLFAKQQDNIYLATQTARSKQAEIINGYYADIAKHAGKVNAMHIDRTWRAIPRQLSQTDDSSTKKFKFKDIIPNVKRYSQLVNVIDWLEAAELAIKVPIINTIKQPLSAFTTDNQFKLLMFDVGILGAISELDPKTILDYDYGTYKGYFAENFVAQQLTANTQKTLYNWQENRSEIEFILQFDGEGIPIEVKAGEKTRTKSLHKYIEKYQPSKSFLLSGKNIDKNNQQTLKRLPLYLTEWLFSK